MALVVPNPTVPTNGQSLDATPLLANLNAVYQAIQSFDGSQIQAATIVAAAMAANINPNTILNETIYPFVFGGGLIWSVVSGLNGTMTSGTAYINNPSGAILRVPILSVASNAFAINKDTYVYIDYNGNITYSAVANNAASPSATANAILVAVVVTSGVAITSINQGSMGATVPLVAGNILTHQDSLGNLIYPSDPTRKTLGYRVVTTPQTITLGTFTDIAGLVCPIITPVGRKLIAKTFMGSGQTAAASTGAAMTVNDVTAGVQIEQADNSAGAAYWIFAPEVPYTPPASGARTFKATAKSDGTHNLITTAGPNNPVWLRIDLG